MQHLDVSSLLFSFIYTSNLAIHKIMYYHKERIGGISMAKYTFPAILSREDDGSYSVSFPDIVGCYTCGDDMADALMMAEDALALMLYDMESKHEIIPSPSDPSSFKAKAGQYVTFIACDTFKYQRMHNTKAVKRTISLPAWLNDAAMERGINFSQVLQDGLKKIILN